MPAVHVDQLEVHLAVVDTSDTDGTAVELEGVIIPVIIPEADVVEWLTAYDQANQYSPSATDSRVIARAVLDALKKAAATP